MSNDERNRILQVTDRFPSELRPARIVLYGDAHPLPAGAPPVPPAPSAGQEQRAAEQAQLDAVRSALMGHAYIPPTLATQYHLSERRLAKRMWERQARSQRGQADPDYLGPWLETEFPLPYPGAVPKGQP